MFGTENLDIRFTSDDKGRFLSRFFFIRMELSNGIALCCSLVITKNNFVLNELVKSTIRDINSYQS
jgi:hypothetical protein